jgi:hypothetical protein
MTKVSKLMIVGFAFALAGVFLTCPAFSEEKSPLFDAALKNSVASLSSSEIAISPGMAVQDSMIVVAAVADRNGLKALTENIPDQLAQREQIWPTAGRTCQTCGVTCGGPTCGATCGGATCGGATCGGATCGPTCGGRTCTATCGELTCGPTCLGGQTCNSLTCQGITCGSKRTCGPGCNPSPSR